MDDKKAKNAKRGEEKLRTSQCEKNDEIGLEDS